MSSVMVQNRKHGKNTLTPDGVFSAANDDDLDIYDGVRLTNQEVAFVEHYVGEAHFSAVAAYEAIYGRANYSYASKIVRKPHIAAAIRERLNALGLSAEAALVELADVALAEWRDFLEVRTRAGEVVQVKMDLSAKVRALEIILRAHNRLDNSSAVAAAVQININTPGLSEDELA